MRVLFVTPPLAFQNMGGGEIQMLKTKKYLEKLFNLEIDIFNVVETQIKNYNIVHFFGSEYVLYPIVEAAKELGKKVIISPIFYDTKHYLLYKIAINISQKMPFRTSVLDRMELLKLGDLLLPNSEVEKEYIIKAFSIPSTRLHIIHNGIDVEKIDNYLKEITPDDEKRLKSEYKISGPYFLYVGRFDRRKNQLSLIKAFNEVAKMEKDVQMVLIGSPNVDSLDYYQICKREAEKSKGRIIFIPALSHEDKKLWIFYKCAFAHIMPSLYETPGLASLEAGYCGCRLIVTEGGATKEYFGDDSLYVNPNNIEDIKQKMLEVLNNSSIDWESKIQNLRERICKEYNWKDIALKTFEMYKLIGGY